MMCLKKHSFKEEDCINTGSWVLGIRESVNMSQESFGSKIGVSSKSISVWERNKANPPIFVINRICRIFGVDFKITGREEVEC
jgi:DNA-binding XRE family transcriptional regulator